MRMTNEELLSRLNKGVEWNDFEIKEAKNEVPKTAWETVGAFSNSYGGWIVFGVIERRAGGKSTYEIQGVDNAEKKDGAGFGNSSSIFVGQSLNTVVCC